MFTPTVNTSNSKPQEQGTFTNTGYQPPSFSNSKLVKEDNFPPCYPIVYHNRNDCGPKKGLADLGWAMYLVTFFLTLLNAISSVYIAFSINFKPMFIPTVAMSITSCILNPLVGMIVVYWPIYNAALKSNSLRYSIALISSFSMLLNCFIWAMGLPVISCGLINGFLLKFFGYDNAIIKLLNFTLCFAWVVSGMVYGFICFKIFSYFRADGCTVNDALRELKKSMQKTKLDWISVFKNIFGSGL